MRPYCRRDGRPACMRPNSGIHSSITTVITCSICLHHHSQRCTAEWHACGGCAALLVVLPSECNNADTMWLMYRCLCAFSARFNSSLLDYRIC